MGGPWLQSLEMVERPDLLISSPDGTLNGIKSLLERNVGVDLDTGSDVRTLRAAVQFDPASGSRTTGSPTTESQATRVVIGSDRDRVYDQLQQFAVVEVAPSLPAHRNVTSTPLALVGLHGFADRVPRADTVFSMQTIDDWGIEDVMAAALDLASRDGPAPAVLFDLAVLDPAYDSEGTIPGGLDMRRLLRGARTCGRNPDVAAAGFVRAGSDPNLVYAVLAFCAGLASR